MRGAFLVSIFVAWALSFTRAESALDALSHIPKGQAVHLAKLEARDGSPEPDRWYILVYDGTSETGVHEFVVANGQVVASRALSQFADSLMPDDVIDAGAIQTDSAQAAKVAAAYAAANGVSPTSIDYELKKPTDATPLAWRLSCLNDAGVSIGEVTVTAAKGEVLSHEGFPKAPEVAAATPAPKPAHAGRTPKFDVYAESVVTAGAMPSASPEEDGTARRRRRTAQKEGGIGGAFKSFGHKVHNFFSF